MIDQQHAYPGYGMERAFIERTIGEHAGVCDVLALGLLETTEIYATWVASLRELCGAYKALSRDATTGRGLCGTHPQEWEDRRAILARECARQGIDDV